MTFFFIYGMFRLTFLYSLDLNAYELDIAYKLAYFPTSSRIFFLALAVDLWQVYPDLCVRREKLGPFIREKIRRVLNRT